MLYVFEEKKTKLIYPKQAEKKFLIMYTWKFYNLEGENSKKNS